MHSIRAPNYEYIPRYVRSDYVQSECVYLLRLITNRKPKQSKVYQQRNHYHRSTTLVKKGKMTGKCMPIMLVSRISGVRSLDTNRGSETSAKIRNKGRF